MLLNLSLLIERKYIMLKVGIQLIKFGIQLIKFDVMGDGLEIHILHCIFISCRLMG